MIPAFEVSTRQNESITDTSKVRSSKNGLAVLLDELKEVAAFH